MSSRGGWSRRPGASGLGVTAWVWLVLVVRGAAACWLDMESCFPWSRCGAWGSLGLLPGCCRPWLCCGGLGSCGVAAGAGCESSCACVRVCVCACVRVVGVDEAIKGH